LLAAIQVWRPGPIWPCHNGPILAAANNDKTCEFTNTVHSSATPELEDFLGKQGIPWEVFKAARKPISEAHNRQETPLFAKSIERHALNRGARVAPASTPAFEKV